MAHPALRTFASRHSGVCAQGGTIVARYQPRRIAGHGVPCRNAARDDAARADDRIIPDGHSGQKHGSPADPYIVPDLNRMSNLLTIGTLHRILVMFCAIYLDAWAKQRTRPDRDATAIEDCAARIDVDALAKPDVEALGALKRGFKNALADACEEIRDHCADRAGPGLVYCARELLCGPRSATSPARRRYTCTTALSISCRSLIANNPLLFTTRNVHGAQTRPRYQAHIIGVEATRHRVDPSRNIKQLEMGWMPLAA